MTEEQGTRPSEDKRPAWVKLVFAVLALVAVGVLLARDILAPPDPVAAPFTRLGGDTRVETALEASRLWQGAPTPYVVIPSSSPTRDVWDATACALQFAEGGPIPLLFEPPQDSPRHARFDKGAKSLGGRPIDLAQCQRAQYDAIPTDPTCSWAGDGATTRPDDVAVPWWVLDVDGRRIQPDLPPWAPCRSEIAPTVVVAAAKGVRASPDVAVGLVVAARLADEQERRVTVLVVPSYLEADLPFEDALRTQTTEVRGGVLIGQTLRIPEETRVKLRAVLPARASPNWFERLQSTLTPLEAIIIGLLSLFGAKGIAEATGLTKPARTPLRWPRAVAAASAVAVVALVLMVIFLTLDPQREALSTAPANPVKSVEFQRVKDLLLVVLTLLTTGIGYWIGTHRRAQAERRADEASRVADAERRKVDAIVDASGEPGLIGKARAAHPEAFRSD